jgi:DNA recombination protein RmuC
MALHAKDLLGHVQSLARRGYQESSQSPDYVVLFAPFESILTEALEADPQLLNKAFDKGVTIATPTTMMALLRTVAYVFNQSDMAHNAQEIQDLATELMKRIGRVHGKLAKLGQSIKSSERAFNDVVQSAEENMLKPARKMAKLGAGGGVKIKALEAVESEVREIRVAPELLDFDSDDGDLELTDLDVGENIDHDD